MTTQPTDREVQDLEADVRSIDVNAEHRAINIDDDVVRRPATDATPTVHSFLRHIREQGLDCVPEPLGVRDGVETLRFMPGASGADGWYHQHTDEGLASAARLLRTIHDAGRSWEPPRDAVWGAPGGAGDDLIPTHADPGPWNFVWRDRQAVGLIDWDYLNLSPPVSDVAYALHWFAPLRSDHLARVWHHFPEVPDRRHRVHVFLAAYGELPAFDVVDTVCARMEATNAYVQALADSGQEPHRTLVADGKLERAVREVEWVREHRTLIE